MGAEVGIIEYLRGRLYKISGLFSQSELEKLLKTTGKQYEKERVIIPST